MRTLPKMIVALLVPAVVSPAVAGITVTSYSTLALSNAYAPVGGTQYIEQQVLTNVSPALAEVSGDWMGTNAGGSTPTWHYVGMARATSTTAFDANSLTVMAAGSFSYEIITTDDFIDPRSSTIFTPAAAANYEALFNTDVPTTYTISAQLNQRGRVRLSSFEGGVVFDRSNPSPTPMLVNLTGTIASGHYHILTTTGLGAPNLPNGVNHFEAGGSYESVLFTVQVPEPNAVGVLIAMSANALRRRRRCACAGRC